MSMRAANAALALSFAIAAVLGRAPTPAGADIDGDVFSSDEWGIELTAPRHWQMSERTSYPNILLWMTHSQPAGRILLSVEVRTAGSEAASYAAETAKLLAELGFTIGATHRHGATGAVYFDFDNCGGAASCDGKVFLRQAFLVSGNVGYTLTLAAPDLYSRSRLLRAFDYTLGSISIRRPKPAEPGESAVPEAAP